MALLCMVTYLTNKEIFTGELREIAASLYDFFGDSFKVILCCEKKIPTFNEAAYPIEQSILPNATKYRRLIHVIENDDSTYFLSVDNDVKCDTAAVQNFLTTILQGVYDIGWGKIRTQENRNIISKLVAVDKLLSHNILRPMLWKLGVGISVPGQIFCIKGASYRGKLNKTDTTLDDLAVGLYSSNAGKKFLMSPCILGYERPNVSFEGLWQQRVRWARGYMAILHSLKKRRSLAKVIIHSITYHFLWIIHWIIFLLLMNFHFPCAIGYVFLVTLLIGQGVSLAGYALLYQMVFPIFHVCWTVEVISEFNRLR